MKLARRWGLLLGFLAVVELMGRLTYKSAAPAFTPPTQQPVWVSIHVMGTATNLNAEGAVALLALCLLTILPISFLRPAVAAVVITTASVLCIVIFQMLTIASLLTQLLAGYWLGRHGRDSGSQGVAVALAVPFVTLALLARMPTETRVVVDLLASLAAPAALVGIIQRRDVLAAGAAEQAVAGTEFEYMARGERARIARELHDVVAHHISMIVVQAETARLTTPGMPELGARRLTEISETGRAGLTEMRRLLGVLREDAEEAIAASAPDEARVVTRPGGRQPQPGLPELYQLLDEAREASGTGVRLIISGPVTRLDPGVELAVYRIVQEALTNSRRHAAGAAVDVELRFEPDALRLRVRDDGPATPAGPEPPEWADANGSAANSPAAKDPAANGSAGSGSAGSGSAARDSAANGTGGSGHGLLGMRERAQAAGGHLRAGPAATGGFLVEATLPAQTPPVTAGSAA